MPGAAAIHKEAVQALFDGPAGCTGHLSKACVLSLDAWHAEPGAKGGHSVPGNLQQEAGIQREC